MYIKRDPPGSGRLTYRRQRKFPIIPAILYVIVLLAAAFVFWQREHFQSQVAEAIGPTPEPTMASTDLMAMGDEAYYDGRLKEAKSYYEQAADIDPTNIEALVAASRTNTLDYIQSRNEGSLERAVALAEQAVEAHPEDPRGYAALSRALSWSDNYTEAESAANTALDLDPEYALGHAYLAEAYLGQRRLRQAVSEAERAIELDPYSVDARRNYGWILTNYGDFKNAIIQYEQALRLEPNRVDVMYELALNYKWSGNPDRAVEMFNDIVRRVPEEDKTTFYVEIGLTFFEVRDDGAAQEYFGAAIQSVCNQQMTEDTSEEERESCPVTEGLWAFSDAEYEAWLEDPTVPDNIYQKAWTSLGQVYFVRRNYEDAIDIFETVIQWNEEQGDDAPLEAYYIIAAAYYSLDECDRGIPYAEKAFSLWQTAVEENDGIIDAGLQNILTTILRNFVLCRDYAGDPYRATGEDFSNGFPIGYEEPEVELSIEDINGNNNQQNEDADGDEENEDDMDDMDG